MGSGTIYVATDFAVMLKSDEMQSLMLATPEVARRAGPILRMFGMDDAILQVPDSYTGRRLVGNKHFLAPVSRRPVDRMAEPIPVVIPEGYVEERDGRIAHPLRDPSWAYQAYYNYKAYLYYYLDRMPPHMRRG